MTTLHSNDFSGRDAAANSAPAAASALRYAAGACWLGAFAFAMSETGLAALILADDASAAREALGARFPGSIATAGAELAGPEAMIRAVIDDPAGEIALPLDLRGTPFQQRVWAALRAIPAGETRSYADIAAGIGAPSAVRAVAGACGANPIAIAVPCHRVLRSDGALSGYRWGVERKRMLLAREGVTA